MSDFNPDTDWYDEVLARYGPGEFRTQLKSVVMTARAEAADLRSQLQNRDAVAAAFDGEEERLRAELERERTQNRERLIVRLRATMVDPKDCVYCEGTGWVFLDKSYDGYPHGRGPYIEPDDTNGGYEACGRCNSDEEVAFGSGETVKPWRRWTDKQIEEIARAALSTQEESK